MVKKESVKAARAPRVRQATRRQRRARTKKDAAKRTPLAGGFRLTWQSLCQLRKSWLPLGGILLIYVSLNIAFASALGDLGDKFDNTKASWQGRQLDDALSGFGSLFGSIGASDSETGVVLEVVLLILVSLVIIWALRQLLAGKTADIKAAYYKSTGQLVPFLLVTGALILELLPLALGVAMLDAVLSGNAETWGVIIFGILAILFALVTIYMFVGSLLALYIVTLPDMKPIAAIRSANNLVRFRRLAILRRLVFLPVSVLTIMALLTVPLILFVHILVIPVFFVLCMLSVLYIHTYLYGLYRSLLR